MKGFNKVFRVVLCMSVLAVTLSVPATRAAGPPSGLDVNVVNTSSNPVPVTLQGAGTVSGSVAITNTPNVNVANTPTVHVSGTVQTQTGIPSGAFSLLFTGLSEQETVSGPDPAGTSYAITSLTMANTSSISSGVVSLIGSWGTTSDCSIVSGTVNKTFGPFVVVPANATVHLSFPQPFVHAAQPGAVSCLVVNKEVTTLAVTVVGFRF